MHFILQDKTEKRMSKSKSNDVLSESFATMANSFNTYLSDKQPVQSVQTQSQQIAPLKHVEMWTHFDKLVTKLNDEEIEDLNFEISNVIRDALKKKRAADKQ